MLIDSGAEVSVIARACVRDDVERKRSDLQLIAVSGEPITTLGKIEATFSLEGKEIKHPLYIVEGDTLKDSQWIIGIDFLKSHV